jgi:hypothetical protein
VVDLGQFIDDCRQIAQECTRDRSSRAVSDPTATPTCCGIQPGSSWPIRVWILGRCNTISATRTSSIRFDIANFLPNGFAISGRIREHLAARGSREAASVSPRSRASAFDESPIFSRPASIRSPERCALPYSHGHNRLAEWLQYQVQPGPMQPVSSAVWPAFWDQVSSRI